MVWSQPLSPDDVGCQRLYTYSKYITLFFLVTLHTENHRVGHLFFTRTDAVYQCLCRAYYYYKFKRGSFSSGDIWRNSQKACTLHFTSWDLHISVFTVMQALKNKSEGFFLSHVTPWEPLIMHFSPMLQVIQKHCFPPGEIRKGIVSQNLFMSHTDQ